MSSRRVTHRFRYRKRLSSKNLTRRRKTSCSVFKVIKVPSRK